MEGDTDSVESYASPRRSSRPSPRKRRDEIEGYAPAYGAGDSSGSKNSPVSVFDSSVETIAPKEIPRVKTGGGGSGSEHDSGSASSPSSSGSDAGSRSDSRSEVGGDGGGGPAQQKEQTQDAGPGDDGVQS